MKKNILNLLVIILLSCKNETEKVINIEKKVEENKHGDTIESSKIIKIEENSMDTTNLSQPDFFELPQDVFEEYKKGKIANWFISIDKKSKLYIVPYTDYSITTAVLTEDKIPDSNFLNLIISEGTKVEDQENAIKVSTLSTIKGIALGLDKTKVISILGKNYQIQNYDPKNEVLKWENSMKESEKDKSGGLRPIILNGLSHNSIAYFRKNKLSAIIFTYEVP